MPHARDVFRVGGISIDAVNLGGALDRFFHDLESGEGGYVCVASSHGVVEAQTDSKLADIMNAAKLTIPDGMPLAIIGRAKAGRSRVSRVPGAEFMEAALRDPRAPNARHLFYGSTEPVLKAVTERAAGLIGADAIAGGYCPSFRPAGAIEDAEVIEELRKSRPTVIWVGLSTPKQEYWMANHAAMFPGAICIGVGAAFDFLAQTKSRGPRALQKSGFEWLYRLISEPGRLWPRYRHVVPKMLGILGRELLTSRSARRIK